MEQNENQNLGAVWREETSLSTVKEEPKREKTIFFLGERIVNSVNPVIFENGIFFVERTPECLIIRPKSVKEYLKRVKGTGRMAKFEREAKDILIPGVAENPMNWFEKKYVESSKQNQQGRFIQEIWKHKKEVFSGGTME